MSKGAITSLLFHVFQMPYWLKPSLYWIRIDTDGILSISFTKSLLLYSAIWRISIHLRKSNLQYRFQLSPKRQYKGFKTLFPVNALYFSQKAFMEGFISSLEYKSIIWLKATRLFDEFSNAPKLWMKLNRYPWDSIMLKISALLFLNCFETIFRISSCVLFWSKTCK